ncbi:MAG: NAD(P)-dependent oxidoreductase [Candidatus Promineifilaceae bacterium]
MNVLILTHLDVDTIMKLQKQHDVSIVVGANNDNLSAYFSKCEILIYRGRICLSAELLAQAPNLKRILRLRPPQNDVDFDYLRERGIEFMHIPRPTARAVAELTFGLMLGLARKIRCMDRVARRGERLPRHAEGITLEGKTLGIVGAGKIGRMTGELGRLWGMRVVGCVARPTQHKALKLREHGIELRSLDNVISSADFLSIHVPYSAETHHLISDDQFDMMKSGAFLLHMGDGGVVDEFALYEALIGKHLAGAALDAHETTADLHNSPLCSLSNVLLTPNIGAFTHDVQRGMGKWILQAIDDVAK